MSQKFIGILLLVFTIVSCGGSHVIATPPAGPIEVKPDAAEQLKQNAFQALTEASTEHESTFHVTDEQITSLVAIELTHTGQIPLSQPQIWFSDGKIHLTGLIQGVAPVDLNAYVVGTAFIQDGQLVFEVIDAQMEQFSFPEATLQTLTETVNEALTEASLDLEITHVEILEGEMVVKGKSTQ